MWVVRQSKAPVSGTINTPHELNAEVAALLGQHNGGLDRENVGDGQITDAKVGIAELFETRQFDQDTHRTVTLTDSSHIGAVYPMPDDAGAPWIETATLDEAADLKITLGGTVAVTSVDPYLHLYIFVNGVSIAELDAAPEEATSPSGAIAHCFELDGRVALPAGTHTIEFKWGHAQVIAVGSTVAITFEDRAAYLDWIYR